MGDTFPSGGLSSSADELTLYTSDPSGRARAPEHSADCRSLYFTSAPGPTGVILVMHR